VTVMTPVFALSVAALAIGAVGIVVAWWR